MNWQPIRRTNSEIIGRHSRYMGLLEVEIEISGDPPGEWAQAFQHPEGVGISLSMHPPRLSGAIIYITPPDNEIESYVAHVDDRIRAANATYEKRYLPNILDREEARNQAAEEERLRLEDARRRLKKL